VTVTPLTPTLENTITPTVGPDSRNDASGGFQWLAAAAGFILPFMVLAFGFLGIAVFREARKPVE
jgi:hypothetical protein